MNGVVLPDQVAGHPGLELCNTRAGWGTAAPREYLTGDHALALWALDAGLVPGPLPRRIRARPGPVTVRAHALREALYACALGRGSVADWDVIGQAAAAARADALLRPGPGETPGAAVMTGAHAEWDLTILAGSDPARAALHSAARAAEDLLRSPLADRGLGLPRRGLRLALRRPPPSPALVLDGRLRQPGQGPPPRLARLRSW